MGGGVETASMSNSSEAFCSKNELEGDVKSRDSGFCFVFVVTCREPIRRSIQTSVHVQHTDYIAGENEAAAKEKLMPEAEGTVSVRKKS